MAFHSNINTGTIANDGTGDGLKTNLDKLIENDNFLKGKIDHLEQSIGISTLTVAITLELSLGDIIITKGYSVIGDGGHGLYQVKSSYAHIDNAGLGFDLPNGNKLVLISEIKKAAHFGIFPDAVTNWEATEPIKYNAIKDASLIFRIHWEEGLYKTGLNISNLHSGMKMHFNNTEFGSIIHLLSGNDILNETAIGSLTSSSGVITITTTSAHGMNDNRWVYFQNTGTDLDSGEYLATIIDTTTFNITSSADISSYTSGGFASDAPLRDVNFTGSVKTYDRFGTINLQNFQFDTIIAGSDTSKNTYSAEGRGIHIYTNCKDWYGKKIICEDTALQAASTNLHAAIAIDGTGQENINIDTLHVYDSGVTGVIIQSNGCTINNILVDAYGRGPLGTLPISATASDIHGKQMSDVACGVWLIRSAATIGTIHVKNKNHKGEAYTFTDRPNIYADVMIDRSYIDWDLGFSTFVESRSAQVINNIICENVINMAVSGANAFINAMISNLNVYRIAIDNPMLTNTVERDKYAFVFHSKGRLHLEKVTFNDIGIATAWRSVYGTDLNAFFSIKNVYIHKHTSTIGVCGNAYLVENIYTDSRNDGDDAFALIFENNSNRSEPSIARNIKLMNISGYAARAIDFASDYATLENVFIWTHGTSTGATLKFSGRMSKIANVFMSGNSETSSDGFEYAAPYRGRTESIEVTGYTGTGVLGSGPNIIATNCISTGNGVASSLAVAQLVSGCVSGFGNYAWTV